jgi:acetyltransferase-like isoleucine patch superfamily enzyme
MADWRTLPWRLVWQDGPMSLSRLRRIVVLATHRHARVSIAPDAYLGPRFSLWIPGAGTLAIGEGVSFRRGFTCEITGEGRVTIGAHTVFTSDALLQCTTSIDIGRNCIFSQSALIVDGNHRFRDPTRPTGAQGFDFRPVRIGDGVGVMAKCTIIGATIGENAFIGANSVVTQDIPAFTLAVGAPAKVVDSFGP